MGLWGLPSALSRADGPEQAGSAAGRARLHGPRLLVALALAVLTRLLFPGAPAADTPVYDVGSVAPETVVAPFAFRVPKPDAALASERADASRAVPAVFALRPAGLDSARARLAAIAAAAARLSPSDGPTAFGDGVRLTPAEVALLRQPPARATLVEAVDEALERFLPSGVATNADLADVRGSVALRLPGGSARRDGLADTLVIVGADSLRSFATLVARATPPALDAPGASSAFMKLLSASFVPTLVPDRAATARARAEAAAAVDGTQWAVRAGEKIVGTHEVVGRAEYEKLRALREAGVARSVRGNPLAGAARWTGAVLFNLALIVIAGLALAALSPKLYGSMRTVGVVAVLFGLVVAAGAATSRLAPERPELIPIAFAAMLCSILFGANVSLALSLVLALLVGSQGPFRGTSATFVVLVAGAVAALSFRTLRRRTQIYRSGLAIASAYAVTAAALGLAFGWDWRDVALAAGAGLACTAASLALAMALLPVAEEATGIDTYLKLLEWSDLNRPLMQRLSLEAPGTYAHTIAMANLVEAACNAIGANGLLGRVGTYYHDIGKLERPQYFVENQPRGRNPHDKLKPGASASIIRSHVREGLALAEEYRLPRAVRAFITEHHGTNRIVYFYEKARERADGQPPNAGEYAYPGPLPRSAETAICMLADGVEAGARALPEPTVDRFRELVDRIVRQRLDQGQLREAPLTLAQLETVKEQFVRVLLGMYHNRIDYPTPTGGEAGATPAAPELTTA